MNLDADPYRTLGLTRGASLEDVKRAYRRLAKANHPDAAGAASLPRFLAIQAAYEQLAGGSASSVPGGPAASTARRRPSTPDADRADATRRAYGGRPRESRPGAAPAGGTGSSARGTSAGTPGAGAGAGRPGRAAPRAGSGTPGRQGDPAGPGDPGPAGRAGATAGTRASGGAGATDAPGATGATGSSDANGATDAPPGGTTEAGPARGKATLGSTSYDGADAGPFEPDWGGASWYGTTSGTYWTINPKEYADPRKHGPEYQARARRTAATPGVAAAPGVGAPTGTAATGAAPSAPGSPTHTTSSWWDSTSDRAPEPDEFAADEPRAGPADQNYATDTTKSTRRADARASAQAIDADEPAPDPARAAIDLARALTDPRSGGLRGRAVRAVLGWLPIALGLGWLVGELTGCGRFAATCDPSVTPLTAAGQAIVLAVLFLTPELAAIAAGASLVLLAAATAATLILSATGTAADEGSRRAALAALLMVAWLSGLGIAVVRRVRSGLRPPRPVS